MGSSNSKNISFTYNYFSEELLHNDKGYFILDSEHNKYLFKLIKEYKVSLRISMERLEHSIPGSVISFKLPEHCDCKSDIKRENPHCIFSVIKTKEGFYKKQMFNIDRLLLKFFNELEEEFISHNTEK